MNHNELRIRKIKLKMKADEQMITDVLMSVFAISLVTMFVFGIMSVS